VAVEMTCLELLADDVADRLRAMSTLTLGRSAASSRDLFRNAFCEPVQHSKRYAIHHANVADALSARVHAQLPAQQAAQGAAAWI